MKHSHPNHWAYGGILESIRWSAGPTRVTCWNGVVVEVANGDPVLVLKTGMPAALFVCPDQAERALEVST